MAAGGSRDRSKSFRAAPVTAPALEDSHDRGSSAAATLEFGPEGPTERPLLCAGAVSVLLHALLFLTIGLASFESRTTGTAPELRLYVESSDSGDAERDPAGTVERPAAPVAKPSEAVLASRAGMRPPVIESPSGAATPSVPPMPDETRDESIPSTGDAAPDAGPSTGSEHGDSPAVEADVVTTVGPSAREEPVHAEVAKQPQPGVPIGNAQETLARWILKAAQSLQDSNQTQVRLSLQHKGRRYAAFLERRPAADEMGIDRLRVEISTQENGKRLMTWLELKRLAFSHFTQLVDDWDQEDQLHGDVIVGRFHSNSVVRLRLDRIATPRVLGKLTTAASQVKLEDGGPRALRRIFRGGIETNTPRIALPADFRSFLQKHADSGKTRTFERSTRVTFYPDGSYGWQETGSLTAEQRQDLSAPQYIVAGRGATLAVHGTVKGVAVVYSPERIVIEGSLVYAHDPRSDAGAEDYLGLISSKDVEIAPPNVTGPGDLEIQAAIYAKRRFVVSDESVPGGPTACPCAATLSIHGSLTAGSLSPTEPRYATHYDFDNRFEQVRPPGFPVTDRYEVDTWDPEWREAEDDRPPEGAEDLRLSSK